MSDFAKQYIHDNLSSDSDKLHEPSGTYLDFLNAARELNLKYDAYDKEDRTFMTIYDSEDESKQLQLVFG